MRAIVLDAVPAPPEAFVITSNAESVERRASRRGHAWD
jgi:hypothetical protein